MKTIKLLFLLSLISCSEPNDDCNCIKETWQPNQYTYIGSDGLPRTGVNIEIISTEEVGCVDEVFNVNIGNNTYYDIECFD